LLIDCFGEYVLSLVLVPTVLGISLRQKDVVPPTFLGEGIRGDMNARGGFSASPSAYHLGEKM